MRRFVARLSALVFRRRAEREMSREIAAHLTLLEDDFRRRGMSDARARLAARQAFGGVEQSKELHRDARTFVWLEQLFQDLRHVFRSLAKSPGFVAVAVLSLALGIGANTAIFTLVNGILLKKLPLADADRIVEPVAYMRGHESRGFSYPVFRALGRQTGIFSEVIGSSPRQAILQLDGEPVKIGFDMVTGSYFAFFRARPALGRLIGEEDDLVEGARPVCVLSYAAWQAYFGGDPRVLRRSISIDGVPLQVIGVAARNFTGSELQRRYDVWAPTAVASAFTHNPRETPNYIWLHLLARLKVGLSFAQANARMAAASRAVEDGLPAGRANANAVYRLLDGSKGADAWRSTLHDPLVVLMAGVTLVLLVACANLANLILARTHERGREFAVKLALGISARRLLRQLLLETAVLACAGGAAGLLLSLWLTRFLLALFNAGNPWTVLNVAPDVSVLLYTFAACVLTALVAGLVPAWRASRTDAGSGLRGGSAAARGSNMRRGLILVQVTLAVVLLFGASLFAHSIRKLKTIDLGYDIDRVLSIDIEQRGRRTPAGRPPESAEPGRILERVRALPGVESAAFADPGVLTGGMMAGDLAIHDGASEVRQIDGIYIMYAGTDYFATLREPLVRGRDFKDADRFGPPVAIVNQRLASLAWPGENPIGRHLDAWGKKNAEVIGVVGNSKYQRLREDTRAIAYLMFEQNATTGGTLQIRARGSIKGVERDVRTVVRTEAPDYQVSNAASMELLRDNSIAKERLLAVLSSMFGTLGSALALVGIYGLIAYSVARRVREIGIRVSIGAQRGDVLWLFLRESLALIAGGLVIGLPIALGLARFLAKFLYEVSPSDRLGVAATVGLLIIGGLTASLIPALRATRVDPVRALRYE